MVSAYEVAFLPPPFLSLSLSLFCGHVYSRIELYAMMQLAKRKGLIRSAVKVHGSVAPLSWNFIRFLPVHYGVSMACKRGIHTHFGFDLLGQNSVVKRKDDPGGNSGVEIS
jgi:hypothetical protein